jgi:hypothetical protein
MLQAEVVENIKTQILFSVTFFSPENRGVYEIMWKNIVDPERLQMAIWRTRVVCCIPKATNVRSESVILLLHESASLLLHTYIARLVTDLRTSSHHFPTQYELVEFYSREGYCSVRTKPLNII